MVGAFLAPVLRGVAWPLWILRWRRAPREAWRTHMRRLSPRWQRRFLRTFAIARMESSPKAGWRWEKLLAYENFYDSGIDLAQTFCYTLKRCYIPKG